MTNVRLHGVLAKEYGQNFCLSVGTPRNVLHAIDANRDGFIARVIQLQKEGFAYEIIINKKRLNNEGELHSQDPAETIDLVPVITGSGVIAWGVTLALGEIAGAALIGNMVAAVFWAAVAYALTPAPEMEQQEATAAAGKQSQVFNNKANVANQGAPLPLGYGRLRVGSQVIQSTLKSYPQHQRPEQALSAGNPPIEQIVIATSTVALS